MTDPKDIVTMDVPLLIRLLEYAREDAKDDVDLHKAAENIVRLSKEAEPDEPLILTMNDYDEIIDITSEEEGDFDKMQRLAGLKEEMLDEGFEWWHPLVAIGGGIGLSFLPIFAAFGPSMFPVHQGIASTTWGDVIRHYRKKFRDKKAAKNLRNEDVLELINLMQTTLDASDLGSGVKRHMKGLLNRLEKEMSKNEEELDKKRLLRLLKDVQEYARRVDIKPPSTPTTIPDYNPELDEIAVQEEEEGDFDKMKRLAGLKEDKDEKI